MKQKNKVTYVIHDGQYLKIGIASNLYHRLVSIKSSNPRPLTIVSVYLGTEYENKLHRYLTNHHLCGEWFKFNEDVLKHIDALVPSEYKIDFNWPVLDFSICNMSIHIRGNNKPEIDKIISYTKLRNAINGAVDDAFKAIQPKEEPIEFVSIDGYIPF